MAVFCGKCGAPLTGGTAFCGACGAQVVQAAVPSPPPVYPPVPPPSPWGQTAPPTPPPVPSPWGQPTAPPPAYAAGTVPPAKSGGALKIVLIVLGVLFVGAVIVVGGIVWEVHRVATRIKAAAAQAGLSQDDMKSMGNATQHLNACQYLTASDVTEAIGVPIIEAKSDLTSCHFIAKGSADKFTMAHIAAMGGGKPPADTSDSSDSTDTTSLVDVSVTSGSGRTQMKVQKAVFGGLGLKGMINSTVNGIGDEAYVIGNNMLIARKGDMFIQITYTNCPCSKTQIEPLAKKLVDAL